MTLLDDCSALLQLAPLPLSGQALGASLLPATAYGVRPNSVQTPVQTSPQNMKLVVTSAKKGSTGTKVTQMQRIYSPRFEDSPLELKGFR